MRYLILLLLTGCAQPYWVKDMPDYFPAEIKVSEVADIHATCGHKLDANLLGCSWRLRETQTALVFIKAGLPQDLKECVMQHETKHAMGYNHAPGTTNELNCGV